jgi:hypothetical protein
MPNNFKDEARLKIVANGRGRVIEALGSAGQVDRIRSEVKAEFAQRLALAHWWKRPFVRLRMKREIDCRIDELAPRNACYLRAR